MRSRALVLALFLSALLFGGFESSVRAQPGALLEPNDRVSVGLNVRAEPNGDAEIVAVLQPGDRVTQIGSAPTLVSSPA
jgi:hypothetical protein